MHAQGATEHVNYEQIKMVLDWCVREKKSFLLVLHARHTWEDKVPKEYSDMVKHWREMKWIYVVSE